MKAAQINFRQQIRIKKGVELIWIRERCGVEITGEISYQNQPVCFLKWKEVMKKT